ncbi:MAG: DUF5702 domain-containing protein [Anaerovorax sp.]
MQWKPYFRTKRGSTSIFLVSILFSMIVVVGMFLEASSGKVARSYGEGILGIASDSVLTEYNRTLKRDYGLFAFYGDKELIEGKMKGYIQKSLEKKQKKNSLDLLRVHLTQISVDTSQYQLINPKIFQEEIEKFMKYRLVELAAEEVKDKLAEEDGAVRESVSFSKDVNKRLESGAKSYEETQQKENSSEKEAAQEEIIRDGKRKVKALRSFTTGMTETSMSKTKSAGDMGVGAMEEGTETILKNKGIIAYLPSQSITGFEFTELHPSSLFLVNEYILDRMKHHLMNNQEREGFFNNEVEYILIGGFHDEDNFLKTKRRILVMRTGLNVVHIYTDRIKLRQTAEAAALLTPGPLAPVTQLILITCWSAAESAKDLDVLMEGGKVPVVKSSKDWVLDLEDLLQGTVTKTGGEIGKKGSDYSGYLRILLTGMKHHEKLLRTMDVIQLNVKGHGEGVFQIKDYCVGLDYEAEVQKESGFFSVMEKGIRNGKLLGKNQY